jgi:outer membrane murein-binding lipoprotein Lpp
MWVEGMEMKKVIVAIILAAILIAGSVVFYAFSNRYSMYSPEGGRFKMDKLTGETYRLDADYNEKTGGLYNYRWVEID